MKKIFISAGEQSGDLHGSNLINEILIIDPSIAIHGLGNKRMIKAGLHCIHDMAEKSVMWLHVLTKIPAFLQLIGESAHFFKTEKPDLVILIDYCGLNFYLAKAAKKLNIPVMYYISPQIWAHAKWRVYKLKKLIDKAVVIYPFEVEIYEEADVPVKYVGNPIVDELIKKEPDEVSINNLKTEYGDNIVSLLPGSRSQEIKKILPILLKTAALLYEADQSVKFIISCSDDRHRERIEQMVSEYSIPSIIINGSITEVIKASRLCLAGSGTVTLKIAYYLIPMIIIYKISYFAHFIVKPFLHSPYISLVNKLADDFIVPERLMHKIDYEWLVSSSFELLQNETLRDDCIKNLQKVKGLIDVPGVSQKAAKEALDMII